MTKILFEITDENLESGLRGVPVGYCVTSKVDPQTGLFYHDKNIKELAYLDPEKVIYLLMSGKLSDGSDYKAFCEELKTHGKLHDGVKKAIKGMPREAHPMKLFVAALALMSAFEATGDYKKDCMNVIAKAPELVATIINYHAGWGETPPSKPELGYMENFVQMLCLPKAVDRKKITEVFRVFNVAHYDHGGGNLSVFVGKAVASGLEDMYGSLAAAMCALAGPRHGKANQDCLAFIKEVEKTLGSNASGDAVEKYIRDRLGRGELVFGFGHAVLRQEDPRATTFYEMGEKLFPDHPIIRMALLLRERGPIVLKENPKIQNPYPNVDAMSGAVLAAAGFDYPAYFTLLFGLSRIVGIARQIVYERCEARGGKGTPIVRPKYIYKHPESI